MELLLRIIIFFTDVLRLMRQTSPKRRDSLNNLGIQLKENDIQLSCLVNEGKKDTNNS